MRGIIILLLLLACNETFGQQYHIEVDSLDEGVFLYESFAHYEGNKVGANGLIVELKNTVIVIDTPWDLAQTEELVSWVRKYLKKPIACFVITHAHDDRIGGIAYLKKNNIKSVSGDMTAEAAVTAGFDRPDFTFSRDTLLADKVHVYYPGPGHTNDNTVVFLSGVSILHGGCFLKSAHAKNLGNVADANLEKWPQSIKNVQQKFPEAKRVIPGHGKLDEGAIENTLKLLQEERDGPK